MTAPSRIAINEFNAKKRLEASLNRDLRKIFLKETKVFISTMEKEIGYNTFKNIDDLNKAIDLHFKRIKKKVLKNTDFTKRAFNTYESVMFEQIRIDIIGSFNKLANSELKKAQESENETISGFKMKMLAMVPVRTKLISNVETQPVYESASLINAVEKDPEDSSPEMIGSAIAFGTLGSIFLSKRTKTWVSIFIPTTRDAHAMANGQTVEINRPFIIGGEQLMFPGDRMLGASPSNYMNCYCSVKYN